MGFDEKPYDFKSDSIFNLKSKVGDVTLRNKQRIPNKC